MKLLILLALFSADPICQRVIDGDTIELADGRKVRIAEIDCPESNQPWGLQANQFLTSKIAGKPILLQGDRADRYGRIIAHVSIDGEDVGEALVEAGLAWQYTQYSRSERLAGLQGQARKQEIGIWSKPIPPWEWRRGKRPKPPAATEAADDSGACSWHFRRQR